MRLFASLALCLVALTALAQQAPEIKAGDKVRVACAQERGLDGEYEVNEDGVVQLPFLGIVEIAGLTPTAAAARVENLLRDERIVQEPKVSLEIVGAPVVPQVPPTKDPGPKKEVPLKPTATPALVSVFGAVETPVEIEAVPGATLATVLARVKPNGKADLGAVLLTRADGSAFSFDCRDGAPSVPIQAGDKVEVPELREPQTVTVLGAVGTPGAIEFYPGLTVADAIEKSGGVTPGTEGPSVTLVRKGERTKLAWPEGAQATVLRADDAVEVLAFGPLGSVTVEGSVKRPGYYAVGENTTLASLIRSAGGFEKGSNLTRVAVLRAGEQKPSYFDFLAIEQGLRGDVPIQAGDRVHIEGPGKRRYGPSAAAGLVGIAWLILGR
ncbi:MAG: polysaccharide biosynthesis/export family protein [Fimbriimonadaceae bacterium]